MSTFNMKYIFTKLSLKICIYCFFSSFFFLFVSSSSSLPIFLFFFFFGGGMVYFKTWFCYVAQADLRSDVILPPLQLEWLFFLLLLYLGTYMGTREMTQQLGVHLALAEEQRFPAPPGVAPNSLYLQLQGHLPPL